MRQSPKDPQTPKDQLGRRQFFRALGGGTVAAAVGVAATPMTATDAQAYDPGQDETKGRYRLSDHVKAFYRTNGYETLQNSTNDAGKK